MNAHPRLSRPGKAGRRISLRTLRLLAEARLALADVRAAEACLLDTRNSLLERAWRLGGLLARLKVQIPHGYWQAWICANLPELGSSDGARTENASRCIRFYAENLKVGNSRHPEIFSVESVRKFMWGYVPAKERLQLEGDEPEKPGAHHLTFANEFRRWDYQVRTGRAELYLEEFKHEIAPLLLRIRDILGPELFRKLTS